MATPLSNADFRALMSESRQGGSEKKRRGHKPGENRHRPKKKDSKADAAEEADEPSYRDRAKERRDLGFDQDYKEVMADIRAAENTFSKDETQFLGGDLLRTHLVKGLDRALLHKTRTQLDKQPAQVKAAPAPASKEAPSAGVAATEAARKEPGKRRFTTPLGRAVYQAVFNPPQSRLKVAEMFLPRRMAFRYGGDDDDGDDGGGGNQWGQYNIPTVIRRAAADCPRVQETMLAAVDGDVLEKMSKLMTYLKTASGKKSKRTDRRKILEEYGILQSGAAASARVLGSGSAAAGGRGEGGDQGRQDGAAAAKQPAVQPTQQLEEEDIFGDAGTDYTVTVAERDRTAAPPPPPPPVHDGSYFDTADDMADLPPVAQSQPGASGAAAPASRTAVARPSQRTKEGEAGKKSIIPFEGDDAYNECFPSTFGMGREAYDSDDEKPGTEQPGADAAQKPRSEFASDEDYKRYLGQKGPEATDAKKRMNRETQKLNNQLHRIERIFKDKGRGTSAFRAPPDAEGGARQGGDGGGGGEQPSRAPAKRRRILG